MSMSIVGVELPAPADADADAAAMDMVVHAPPKLVRRATSQILSYYQTEDAGRAYIVPSSATGADIRSGARPSRSPTPPSPLCPDNISPDAYSNGNGTNVTQLAEHANASPYTAPAAEDPSLPISGLAQSDHTSSVDPRAPPAAHQRRLSSRSRGGSDKRRVAIVQLEMDPALSDGDDREPRDAAPKPSRPGSSSSSSPFSSDTGHVHVHTSPAHSIPRNAPTAFPANTLLSRRGILGTFALVAPPDASPSAYTNLTPPLSAPAIDSRSAQQQLARNESAGSSTSSSSGRHHRSQSDAVASSSVDNPRAGHRLRKGSRDIGIVGMSTATSPTTGQTKMDVRVDETKSRFDVVQAQVSPIFQTPSLSKTSLLSSDSAPSTELNLRTMTSKDTKPCSQSPLDDHPILSTRDESISPVIIGVNSAQKWQAPSMASTTYSSYSTSSSTSTPPSPSHSVTSPQAVPNAYLYYQPGIHATAGPLPPPPRQIYPPLRGEQPPPRPPRLHTPAPNSPLLVKKFSGVSITQTMGQPSPAITPSTTSSTLVSSQSEDSMKGGHTREGAFPTSSVIITEATPPRQPAAKEQAQTLKRQNTLDNLVNDLNNAIDEAAAAVQARKEDAPSNEPEPLREETNRVRAPEERRPGLELKREGSRVDLELKHEESRSTFKGEPLSRTSSSDFTDNSSDRSKPLPDPLMHVHLQSSSERHEAGSKQSSYASQKMFDFAIKRFSALPRTPSRLSVSRMSQRSSLSRERVSHERLPQQSRVVLVAKVRSAWPNAMNFGDVMAKKGSLERSLGYARKINELANYDPGLGDWVLATKYNLTKSRNLTSQKSSFPTEAKSPSELAFASQPRHTSRASIGSEMTFPKRVDAYVATDLSYKPSEDQTLPKGPPPTLPYPTLAQGTHVLPSRSLGGSSTSSMRSVPSTLSSNKSGGGGFFASIGRKTSTRKERGSTINAPNKLLSKRQQAAAPRSVQISASPSLPGGPRAPPGRIQRAQSVIAPKTPSSPSLGHAHVGSESEMMRRTSMKRSPSIAPSMARSATLPATQDFDGQVSKLADLLPHADRTVLSGYLRRAGGQDILAIGRYLDDEKNNSLRHE
ncbi:hypothetical protein M0805_007465 [Coniferiporia weirii]|nr:hypothetical protein M0805_007465 [Coniferiporia weirii]